MANRKTQVITLDSTCRRDAGKSFLITEMSPIKSTKWIYRTIIALVNAGVDFPDGAENMGWGVLITATLTDLKHGLAWDQLEPLLDELMECVKFLPNTDNLSVTRGLIESDIEEFTTFMRLQKEVIQLHANFT